MKIYKYFVAMAGLLIAGTAEAGTYTLKGAASTGTSSATTTSVPTLSEWAAIFCSLMIVGVGLSMIKRKEARIAVVLIGAGLAALPMVL